MTDEVYIPNMKDIEKAEKRLREVAKTLGARITKSKARNPATNGYGTYTLSVLNPMDNYQTMLSSYTLGNIDDLAEHLISAQEHYEFEESEYDELHPLWYKHYCMFYFGEEPYKPLSNINETRINKICTDLNSIYPNRNTPFYYEINYHYWQKLFDLDPEKDHGSEPYSWADIEYQVRKLYGREMSAEGGQTVVVTKEKLAELCRVDPALIDRIMAGDEILSTEEMRGAKKVGEDMAIEKYNELNQENE